MLKKLMITTAVAGLMTGSAFGGPLSTYRMGTPFESNVLSAPGLDCPLNKPGVADKARAAVGAASDRDTV